MSSESWSRDAVIYQVYVRSFADSDGDGMGDLLGVASRLDYLAELGVDAVWLTPFYPSPMADGGYDVADYRGVDPRFGTLADFDKLLVEAHARGLKVIIDIVPNHCSSAIRGSRRRWRAARVGRAGTVPLPARPRARWRAAAEQLAVDLPRSGLDPAARRRVVPAPVRPRAARPQLGPPGGAGRVREHPAVLARPRGRRHPHRRGARPGQGTRPARRGEADGRLLVGTRQPFFDQDGVHEIYREWRSILDGYTPERIAVAEAWLPDQHRAARYVRPDELHQAFNFDFLGTPWSAPAYRQVIDSSLAVMGSVGAPTTWVMSNHDVVRHASRLAAGVGGVAGGAARRAMSRHSADPAVGLRRARAATLLMLALPGSAYLYQGEELGLPEVFDLPGRGAPGPGLRPYAAGRSSAATGAGCRCRGRAVAAAVRLRPGGLGAVAAAAGDRGRSCRSRRSGTIRRPRCRCTLGRCSCGGSFPRWVPVSWSGSVSRATTCSSSSVRRVGTVRPWCVPSTSGHTRCARHWPTNPFWPAAPFSTTACSRPTPPPGGASAIR